MSVKNSLRQPAWQFDSVFSVEPAPEFDFEAWLADLLVAHWLNKQSEPQSKEPIDEK
jgi:hypothetical protein